MLICFIQVRGRNYFSAIRLKVGLPFMSLYKTELSDGLSINCSLYLQENCMSATRGVAWEGSSDNVNNLKSSF